MVRLSLDTLHVLAEMICGVEGMGMFGVRYQWPFRYRNTAALNEFFEKCHVNRRYDGDVRKHWVASILEGLNEGSTSDPELPSDGIVRVLQVLMAPADFQQRGLDRAAALTDLNLSLARDGFQAFLDGAGQLQLLKTKARPLPP